MNTILFYRILSVDFSGMFRSASFSPRETRDCGKEQSGAEGRLRGSFVRNVFQEEERPSSDN